MSAFHAQLPWMPDAREDLRNYRPRDGRCWHRHDQWSREINRRNGDDSTGQSQSACNGAFFHRTADCGILTVRTPLGEKSSASLES